MKALGKYVEKRLDHLAKRLDEFVKFGKTETLHEVRVEIKKIKAFLLIAGRSVKGFNAHREFIPFREIFRLAGQLRQPEVDASVAARFGVNSGNGNPYNKAQMDIFLDDIPVFMRRVRRAGTHFAKMAKKISGKDCKRAIKELKMYVRISMSPVVTQSRLHKTRKTIKNILYLDQVLKVLGAKEKEFFTSVEQIIGDFHDKQTLMDSLHAKLGDKSNVTLQAKEDLASIRKLSNAFYAARRSN